jgi:hypothetical protein
VEWLQTPSLATAILFNSIDNQGAVLYWHGSCFSPISFSHTTFLTGLYHVYRNPA